MNLMLNRVNSALQTLQLGEGQALLETHLQRAAAQERTYTDFLCDLVEAEVGAQRTRALTAQMRMVGLAYVKTLAHFNLCSALKIVRKLDKTLLSA